MGTAAHGITLSGATSGSYFSKLRDVSVSGITRGVIDISSHNTTTWSENVPNGLTDPGTIQVTGFLDDYDTDPPVTADAEVWTLTLPTDETWVGSGYVSEFSLTGNEGDAVTYSATIQRSGAWTFGS